MAPTTTSRATPATRSGVGQPTNPSANPGNIAAFENELAALTGLNKFVIEAWVAVEGAFAKGGTGGYNYLNLREHTSRSGVPLAGASPAGFAQFHSPQQAAQETAWWINNMPNFAGIKNSAKMSAQSQITAIAASPWDSGHYNGGKTLEAAYKSVTSGGGGGGFLSGVGSFLGGLPGDANNAAKAVVPGLGTAEGAAGAVQSTSDAIVKVTEFLFNPQDWLRIGYIIGGGLLALGGLFIMAKSVGGSTTVQQAAFLTTPEGRAATAAGLAPKRRPPERRQAQPRTQTRTRTVYVTDPEENRREAVRRRAARAEPSNDIPF